MKSFLSNQKMSFLFRSICFLFLVSSFQNMFVSSTQHLCQPDQRDALLEFKNEFVIPDWADLSIFSSHESWVNKSDCCSWDGVTCAAKSGKVIGLDLSFGSLYGQLKSNSSLFKLRHLRELDLSNNNFSNSPIPAEFDKLMELEILDLSGSYFSGKIPTNLLHLTKLVSLHLSSPYLWVDESFIHLLAQNLRNLRELDLSSVSITSEIPHEFSNLQSLRSLYLRDCNMFGEFPSSVFLIPTLESIDLSQNPNLRGSLPVFCENNSLLMLIIRDTAFSGLIPNSIGNLENLTYLTLSNSNFLGKIPFSLGNLSHLSELDLSQNNLVGEIPSSIGNLKQLTAFDVSFNKLSGNLPASIFNSTQLCFFYLSSNQFTDSIPPIISQFSKLEGFYADNNSFTGAIISSLVKLSSLTHILLGFGQFNDFTGIVDLNVFSALKKLRRLEISGIPLSMANITSNSDFPSHVIHLSLKYCNIIEFPAFIRYGRNLRSLDISNNKMKGQVPDWFWRLPNLGYVDLSNNYLSSFSGSLKASPESQLYHLDLSSNAFQGPLFIPSRHLTYFSGSKNNFTGGIPRSICGLSSLEVLDLSNNNLHGSIPWCLKSSMSSCTDLNLRNNSFTGSLPEIFKNATRLQSLDISHNKINDIFPYTLIGCSSLEVLNVGNNKINDIFPFHLNSLRNLQVLVLRSNKFHGTLHNADGGWVGFPLLKIIDVSHNDFFGILPSDYFLNWTVMSSKTNDNMKAQYIGSPNSNYYSLVLMIKGVSMEMERILTTYTAVDFSGNQLHGQIPKSLGLLKELHILNLSSNAFTGHIPSSLANLTNLESLDISQNNISGEIPPELGTLSSLGRINVSHNQLEGFIPQGTQFQTQNCSSYEGNPRLNSFSLKNVCGDVNPNGVEIEEDNEEEEEEEEEEESVINWIAASIGFGPGIVFGITTGYIMATYKHHWFMKSLEKIKQLRNITR